MSTYKWKRQLIEKLIVSFKKQENLYNPHHPYYINKSKRAASMLQIYIDLKKVDPTLTAEVLRKKLHTIRTQYIKENRTLQDAKRTGNVYVPTLWCFEEMNFLDPYTIKRKEEDFIIKKKFQNTNILQQLKMDIHGRVRNRAERKYEWLGQQVVSEINKIQNEEVQDAIVWEIQKILHEALVKDRLLRKEDTNRMYLLNEFDD